MITLNTQRVTPGNFNQKKSNLKQNNKTVAFKENKAADTHMTGIQQTAPAKFLDRVFGKVIREKTKDGYRIIKLDKQGKLKYMDIITQDGKTRERTFFDSAGNKVRAAIFEGKSIFKKLVEGITYKNGEVHEVRKFGNGHVLKVEQANSNKRPTEDSLEEYLNYMVF